MNKSTRFTTPLAAVAALALLSGCSATQNLGEGTGGGLHISATKVGETSAIADDSTYGRFEVGDRLCKLRIEVSNTSRESIRLQGAGVTSSRDVTPSVMGSRAHEPQPNDVPDWFTVTESLTGSFLEPGGAVEFGELVTCDLDAAATATVEIRGDLGTPLVSVPIVVE